MGTRSLTVVQDEQGKELVNIYRQFDGYPSGAGKDLADFLTPIKLINGISGGGRQKAGEYANGMGCLAAQLVAHFKTEIGNFYLLPPGERDADEEYLYTVHPIKGEIHLTVVSCAWDSKGEGTVVYIGPASEFTAEIVEKITSELG